jgi:hypothetical protein
MATYTLRLGRHGTDGLTSPPKEGVLRIFFALKIRRLRPGANPRTWVPKAGTLPLDHRSRCPCLYFQFQLFAAFKLGHEMAESFLHNHNLDVTLWNCNTRNCKLNFRILAVARQSQRLIPVLLQVNGPCDRTLCYFVCNNSYIQLALYKRNPTGSRIGLHIYTNNDGQFVQTGCVGTTEI